MHTVFFSYGHDKHTALILKIKDYLEKNDFKVFVDSEKLRAGRDWEHQLELAITNNEKFTFFITPYSARRPDGYCLNEIAMALYHNKKIIPVMIDFQIPPLSIVRLQYLDFQDLEVKQNNDVFFESKMKELVDILNGDKKLDFDAQQTSLLKELNPIDFSQDFAKHNEIIGREWIIEEIDTNIINKPDTNVFWITAEAGYGKSAIATYLANTHKDVIGIHYCNYNYENKKNPLNVIKTMAFHLQSQIPEYAKRIKNINIQNKNAYELFETLILNPLKKLDNNRNYIFIIDALDEAIINGSNEIADLIQDEFYKLPKNVKIVVTSRPDKKLIQKLSRLNSLVFDVSNKNNINDCKKYILQKIKDFELSNAISEEVFVEKLLIHSNNNILYLKQFFSSLTNNKISEKDYSIFPLGLNGIYERFFNRITKNEDEYYEQYAPIFELIFFYGENIPKEVIQEVLAITKIQLKRRLNKIGSLIKDSKHGLGFYHKSLKDWLLLEENSMFQIDESGGENLFRFFLKTFDASSYKERFLKLTKFNRILIEFYKKEESCLITYFNCVQPYLVDTKSFSLYNKMISYYHIYNLPISIELLEFTIPILERENKIDSKNWSEVYVEFLSSLFYSYQNNGDHEKYDEISAITTQTIFHLYKANNEKWAFEYCAVLNNLATANTIRNNNAIKDLIKAKDISETFFLVNPEKWLRQLIRTNINLAYSYKKDKQTTKAIEVLEETKKLLQKEFQRDSESWNLEFVHILNNLANLYKKENDIIKYHKNETLCFSFVEKKYKEDEIKWSKYYFTVLINRASYYRKDKKLSMAIALQKKAYDLSKKKTITNNSWILEYSRSLLALALSYKNNNQIPEAILLEEESLQIRTLEHDKQPKIWSQHLLKNLTNLAVSLQHNNDIKKLQKIEQQILALNNNNNE